MTTIIPITGAGGVGPQGPKGDPGTPGTPGAAGSPGPAAWTAVSSWTAATAYVVGPPASVVTHQGETYVCISAHTSAGSFDSSKWTKVSAKGADGADGAAGAPGAQGAQGATGAQGSPGSTGPAAWSPISAWTTSSAYTAGPPADVVTYLGETYVCRTSHGASGSFDSSKWTKVSAKGADGPAAWSGVAAWASTTVYVVGPPASVVTYQGETYVCTTGHTSSGSFDVSKWTKVAAKGADASVTPATSGSLGAVELAGDLSGYSGAAADPIGSATAPKLNAGGTVPWHDHQRVYNPLPYAIHSSSVTSNTANLELGDNVIVLNDNNLIINLPTPRGVGNQLGNPGQLSLTYGVPNLLVARNGSVAGAPPLTRMGNADPGHQWPYADYPNANLPTQFAGGQWAADFGAQMTVTLIQDDVGGHTVSSWRQFGNVAFKTDSGSSGLTQALDPQPAQPATTACSSATAKCATTYLFQWLGIFGGWVCVATSAAWRPFLLPIKSSDTSYIRGFIYTPDTTASGVGVSPTNSNITAATALLMKWPQAVRKWCYDLGFWINPAAYPSWGNYYSGGPVSTVLKRSGDVAGEVIGGYAGGGLLGLTDAGFNREAWELDGSVSAHEVSHLIDSFIYQVRHSGTAAWGTGRTFTVPAGTYYEPFGKETGKVSTTHGSSFTWTAYTLQEDPNLNIFAQQANDYLAVNGTWAGRNNYNLPSGVSAANVSLREWIPQVVGGYLVGLTDSATGDAMMTNAIPPSMLSAVKTYLHDYVFGSGGLGLIA